MEQEFPAHRFPDLHEKTVIMQQQIARCKDALSVMSASAGEMRAESGHIMKVGDYIDNVLTQWRTHKPSTKLRLFIAPDVAADARIIAERMLTHAIINILNNAAEATDPERGIEFYGIWNIETLTLKICDFGPGLPPDFSDIIGEQPLVSKKKGLGVGLFLTCSTINRLGGRIEFKNKDTGGASVEIAFNLLAEEIHND
jgi:two-component system sensor histidine kinase RegB